jgi:hypothetical protein
MHYRVTLKIDVDAREEGEADRAHSTTFTTTGYCVGDSPAPAYSGVMERLQDFLTRCAVDPNQKES